MYFIASYPILLMYIYVFDFFSQRFSIHFYARAPVPLTVLSTTVVSWAALWFSIVWLYLLEVLCGFTLTSRSRWAERNDPGGVPSGEGGIFKNKNPGVTFSSKSNRKTLACWSPALCDPKLLKPLKIISYTAAASVRQHFANRSCDDCYLTAAKRIL